MPLDRVKTFINGGPLTPDDLNDIQDDYLRRFEVGESEWVGLGPLASRPAASAVPGRGWLDDDGTEWRSNGERWLPVGGKLPYARVMIYGYYSNANGPLLFDTEQTDRLTYDQSTRKVKVPIEGRYLVTFALNLEITNSYVTTTADVSLVFTSGQHTPRTVRLQPFPVSQTGTFHLVTYQTTVDLAPAAPGTPATVGANLTVSSSSYYHTVQFAEMNVLMVGA